MVINHSSLISQGNILIAQVTFEPGCRNHWHIHHTQQGGGQILICEAGEGFYQEWRKEAIPMKKRGYHSNSS